MDRDGVYFLANDRIIDHVVCCLNSLRHYNPTVPLCLIPFAADHHAVAALRDRYEFTIFDDDELLAECDAVSLLFHGDVHGHYRKFAAWAGPFERFVYLDCDTVVLRPFDAVLELLDRFDVLTAFSDDPGSRQWVWQDSITSSPVLTPRQVAFAANTGFIASRRAVLPFEGVRRRLPVALELREHMHLECFEQPLLNFMIVTAGVRYASLHLLARTDPWIPIERWAGEPGYQVSGGRIVHPSTPPTLFLHWAGQGDLSDRPDQRLPYEDLWRFYRHLGEERDG